MINIVISRSQQKCNKCVMGDTEADHTGILADKICDILQKDPRLNVLNIPQFNSGDDMADLRRAVNTSNDFIHSNGGTGFHLAIHTDAGGYAKGCSGLYVSKAGFCFGRPIWEELTKISMAFGELHNRTNLMELNQTKATAFLIEVCFHDDLKEAQWLHSNFDNISKAIVKGVYRGMDMEPFVNPPTPPDYRVDIDIDYWKKPIEEMSFDEAHDRLKNLPALVQKIESFIK